MFDFQHSTMLLPIQHDILIHQHTQKQPYYHQVIQLVEGPPPPPRIGSPISSPSSSSCCDEDEDEDDYSDSAPEDEVEESVSSSYCSSDLPIDVDDVYDDLRPEPSTDTFSLRMKRILAWRENFSSHLSATFSEPLLPSSLKRKLKSYGEEDDNVSHSSKRSRSQASLGGSSTLSLGVHSCPACDTSFDTRQSLRQHGRDAKANEACYVAVEYALE